MDAQKYAEFLIYADRGHGISDAAPAFTSSIASRSSSSKTSASESCRACDLGFTPSGSARRWQSFRIDNCAIPPGSL